MNVFGKSAKLDMIVPYVSLAAKGLVFGLPHERYVTGFADPAFRFSMNFIGAPALTLFENKRQIVSAQVLEQAAAQAHRYARALQVASFVVAAPAGMWIYDATANMPVVVRRVTSLELQQRPDQVPKILRQLRAR